MNKYSDAESGEDVEDEDEVANNIVNPKSDNSDEVTR
jgi:hypothetical protein